MPRLLLTIGCLLFAFGCAAPRPPAGAPGGDVVTVEGRVAVRGQEPFTALMLETDEGNLYVLDVSEAARAALQDRSPARFRLTGLLYRADWQGLSMAHLRVEAWSMEEEW